jgi:hypothetical protein
MNWRSTGGAKTSGRCFAYCRSTYPSEGVIAMSSKVRIVKRKKVDESKPVITKDNVRNEQQRNREVIGVIKSWIDEFKLSTASKSEAALILLNR